VQQLHGVAASCLLGSSLLGTPIGCGCQQSHQNFHMKPEGLALVEWLKEVVHQEGRFSYLKVSSFDLGQDWGRTKTWAVKRRKKVLAMSHWNKSLFFIRVRSHLLEKLGQ